MRQPWFHRVARGAVAGVLGLLLVGCGSRVTEANYAKVQAGMSEAEVTAILGTPSETAALGIGPISGTSSVWRDEGGSISIQFVNGKVTVKNFTRR